MKELREMNIDIKRHYETIQHAFTGKIKEKIEA